MKKTKIIIAICISLILFISFGGLYVYIHSVLDSKQLRKSIVQELQATFPNSEIRLGEVDVSFNGSIEISAQKLFVGQKKSTQNILFSVESLEFVIPFLSIMTGGGNSELNLRNPAIFYVLDESGKSNWEKSYLPNENSLIKGISNELTLPSFILNSTLAMRFLDLDFHYQKSDENINTIKVSKFIIKNLGLRSSAAFELKSQMNLKLDENESLRFDTMWIGSLDVNNYLKTNVLKHTSHLSVKNIVLTPEGTGLNPLKGEIVGELEKNGNFNTQIKLRMERSKADFNVSINEDGLQIKEISSTIFLKDYKNKVAFPEDITVDDKSTLNVSGLMSWQKNKFSPDLKFDISNFKIRLSDDDDAFGQATLNIRKNNIDMNSTLSLWDANLDFESSAQFKWISDLTFDKRLSDIKGSINLRGGSFTSKQLYLLSHQVRYNRILKSSDLNEDLFLLPTGSFDVDVSDFKVNNVLYNGSGKIFFGANRVTLKNVEFKNDQGTSKLELETKIFNKMSVLDFDLNLKNSSAQLVSSFVLNPSYSIEGKYSGSVSGNVKFSKVSTYNIDLNIKAEKAALRGLKIEDGSIDKLKLIDSVPTDFIEGLYKKNISFNVGQIIANFKENHFKISKFNIQDKKIGFSMKSYGDLFPSDENLSEYYVTLINNNSRKVPFLFKGEGLSLSPDLTYTINQMKKK